MQIPICTTYGVYTNIQLIKSYGFILFVCIASRGDKATSYGDQVSHKANSGYSNLEDSS